MTRVLIASPVRQRAAILREFLLSLLELDLTGIAVEFMFVDDNVDAESGALLRGFAPNAPVRVLPPAPPVADYVTDHQTHHWLPSLMNRVAAYKDRFLEIARIEEFDAVFLIDSDFVLHPRTLVQLLENDVPICTEICWTSWWPGSVELPSAWVRDQYTLYHHSRGESLDDLQIRRRTAQFLTMLRQPGVYEVGGLGGCTLIRRAALLRGAAFAEIPNSPMIGEDRDFCIRAAALGISLKIDTHFPLLHLYRESDLDRVAGFKAANRGGPNPEWRKSSGNKIVLSMVVRNESGRFLDRVLRHAATYVDAAVIIDDASTDDTVAICHAALGNLPHEVISLPESLFHEEYKLRALQWRRTLRANPDWILNLDADELFEDVIRDHVRSLVDQVAVDFISFPLFDMWNETQYRADGAWRGHETYRPLLVRPGPSMIEDWPTRNQHAGRFPPSATQRPGWTCVVRLKHLGWSREADRRTKYQRYQRLDLDAVWGWREQYESILDPNPTLVDWDS